MTMCGKYHLFQVCLPVVLVALEWSTLSPLELGNHNLTEADYSF